MKPEIRQLLDHQRQVEEIRRIHQLKIEQQRQGQLDYDGDGISNADEWASGTNPYSKDTDGDGYTDLQEFQVGSSLNQHTVDNDREEQESDREREYR